MTIRHSIFAAIIVCLAGFFSLSAQAMPFEVMNVQMTAQSTDAVKAREMALAQAQRKAFAVLVGRDETELTGITDVQIARLVRGFSVRGERLAARAYTANFTIRFNPNATIMFVQNNGFDFAHASQTGPIDANPAATKAAQSAQQPAGTADVADDQDAQDKAALAAKDRTIVVLPVLDIGSQNMLWSDPNPWRELWQEKDYSEQNLTVRVPLGDIADVTDVPDAGFLNGAQYDFASLLARYEAASGYVAIVKNQGADGILLSLYRHDGKKLSFIRKMLVHPRPGFRFNDTIPAAIKMIVMAHNNNTPAADDASDYQDNTQTQNAAPYAGQNNAVATQQNSRSVIVTVPYQSLQQWVAIQNRLRLVSGISSIAPMRVSPSSAKVRLTSNADDMTVLQRNLAAQRFELQYLPTGETVLIDQPY